ncbi:hypothetical protein ALMP_35940 [Streptomyces sp. A012304]|nr:hypothetical protein ALMP_35940 [Streptomyces sp. A012304]
MERLDTAARKGEHGGRPPVITDDMLHTVLRRKALGESVEQIQPDLIIPRRRTAPRPPAESRSSGRRSPALLWQSTHDLSEVLTATPVLCSVPTGTLTTLRPQEDDGRS